MEKLTRFWSHYFFSISLSLSFAFMSRHIVSHIPPSLREEIYSISSSFSSSSSFSTLFSFSEFSLCIVFDCNRRLLLLLLLRCSLVFVSFYFIFCSFYLTLSLAWSACVNPISLSCKARDQRPADYYMLLLLFWPATTTRRPVIRRQFGSQLASLAKHFFDILFSYSYLSLFSFIFNCFF